MTDAVNIKDANVINIGVKFEVITLPEYNSNEVLLKCIDKLKSIFAINRWQINQPIVYSDVINTLLTIKGVQTVVDVRIKNLNDELSGYSNIAYSIIEATRNGIVYPSLDPAMFEIKYPNNDIKGRVVTF